MNRGEWSEFYAFLKLLADGKLYAADQDLNRIENQYYPIIKIIRESITNKEVLFYHADKEEIIITKKNDTVIKKVSSKDFNIISNKLLKIIKSSSSSFTIEDIAIQKFYSEIESPVYKEKSSHKRDITIVIHDIKTGHMPEVGFSIKSKLGGASTLFNANPTTNLTYEVNGLEHLNFETLKDLKPKKLVKKLNENNCNLVFKMIEDNDFEANLMMIDSHFPLILSGIIKAYYSGSGSSSKIKNLTEEVSKQNPCNLKNNNNFFYEHKVKQFLIACALGMTSKKRWDGNFDASGGYIIIKEDGEILCYHIYNWNVFQDYLFNNTFIDTPSTRRHKFGTLEGNKLNLNFQIRFS